MKMTLYWPPQWIKNERCSHAIRRTQVVLQVHQRHTPACVYRRIWMRIWDDNDNDNVDEDDDNRWQNRYTIQGSRFIEHSSHRCEHSIRIRAQHSPHMRMIPKWVAGWLAGPTWTCRAFRSCDFSRVVEIYQFCSIFFLHFYFSDNLQILLI